MGSLWLTYAWLDNDDGDIDHVIGELKKQGLEVRFDRQHIVAGQRLWPRIDAGITDPNTSAWAIFATEASLSSEACLEELAYALDRALRARGTSFPIVGIFPRPMDRTLIPSAIATRKYVNLTAPNWASEVQRAVGNSGDYALPEVTPFAHALHELNGKIVLEVRPRSGRWHPFIVLVPTNEIAKLGVVVPGPSGHPTGTGMVARRDAESNDGTWKGIQTENLVDAANSAYIWLNSLPSAIQFGTGSTRYTLNF
ncbi:MAG: toll/interleukin-1 receptor domain-containing protein [Hyphomonadaceae bacterium]|nr:MAG: hypothetical protein FD160_1371 [Caulobacteraceae bacterium]MBT9444158.1 toll/interleukin-1 receptor domain-containing protein [Hyphomonadaceae bacterium]TPW04902.1 MAG: hypothetical protein FD124_2415 [Alphaproteobacteria bacterium]